MILGFRDRYGDQVGHYAFSNPNDPTRLVSAAAAGDILRACRIGDAFVLEDLGLCRFQGSGVTNNQGPGGGEYYNGDDYSNNAIAGTLHHQIASGALVQVPGRLEVASTVMDPLERHEWAPLPGAEDTVFDAGVRWFDNEIGDYWRSYRIYNGQGTVTDTFGKANGLGDLEAICGPAPLEIGNYVWLDEDRNGIQSPDWSLEPPIAGVWVSLYIFDEDTAERSLVAQTQTDSSGHYYFNELTISAWLTANGISDPDPANYWWDIDGDGVSRFGGDSAEPFGVMPFRTYEVRIDDPRNFDGSSASLFELYATFPTLSEAQRDSDGVAVLPEAFVSVSNFVSSGSFVTGDFGANNHNVDFGFTMTALDEPTEPPTPDQTEEPTEPPTPDQTEEPTEPPTPDQTDEPTQPPTDEPTQPPTDEPTQPPAPPTEPPAPPTEPPAPPIEPPACARHNTERLDCSTIAVTGRCEGNVAVFTIRNGGEPGEGDMVQPTQWRLTDESTGALLQSGQVWLAGGTSMEIRWDGGGTVRLNADQQIGHPGNSRPNQVLSCGSGGGQQGNGNGRGNSQRP
jgi:hypothetical protein